MAEAITVEDNKIAQELCRLLELYRNRRKPHEDRWHDLAEYLMPDRKILLDGVDHKGDLTHTNVYDDIGTHCLQVWADGILGNTASPGFHWARYKMTDNELNKVPEVKRYLQEYEEEMYDEFKNAGIYRALGIFLRDLGSFGTGHCLVGDRLNKPYPLYKPYSPAEVFIGENFEGEIDTQLVEQYVTLAALVDYFGDAVSENRRQQAEKNPLKEVPLLWALVPRTKRIEGLLGQKNKPVASYHVDLQEKRILREGGYDELPMVTARCIMDSGEEYGRSPGSNAIRDVKMANLMSKSNLVGAQRVVDPPTDAPIERRGQVSLNPGAQNWYGREFPAGTVQPILTGISLPAAVDMLEHLHERVKRHFFYDFFLSLLLETRQQTAYEVAEKMGERAVVLAPIIFQYLHEGLDKFVHRTAAIAQRAGRLPVPPDIILESKSPYLDVEYLGPLAQAQRRLFKTQGIRGFMETVAGVPSQDAVLHRVNWDEIVEDLADAHGVPEKDIRTDGEVKKIRDQQAKLQQAMQEAELAKANADAGNKMSKRPEAGSPLEQLMVGSAGSGA